MSRIPAHASTIYTSGNTIHLCQTAAKGYTSELTFPATPEGAEALLRLLRQREVYAYTHPAAIAQPSMPIQHVIDSWQSSTPTPPPNSPAPRPRLTSNGSNAKLNRSNSTNSTNFST